MTLLFDVKKWLKLIVIVLIEFSVIFYGKWECYFSSIRQFFYDSSIWRKKWPFNFNVNFQSFFTSNRSVICLFAIFLWHFKFDVKNYIKYTVVVLIEFSVIFTSNESVIFYVKSKCHFSIRQFFYDNSIRQKKIKNDWKCNVIVLVKFSFTFYVKSKCHKKSSNSSVKFSFPAENSYVKCVNSADAKPVDNKKVQKGTPSSIKGKGESTGTEEKHAIR